MAQRQVVEIECCRCDRKEYREPPPPEEPAFRGDPKQPAFHALLINEKGEGHTVNFEDLCTPCASTIKGHLEAISKKIEGVSPVREKKEKTGLPHPPRGRLDVQTGADGELPHNGVAKKKGPHAPAA